MKRLTTKKVEDYFAWRTDAELMHCPNCIAAACNDCAMLFNHDAKELMKLLLFNDPIPALHTHSYNFNTATGRHIIQTIQEYYYEYKNLEL
tara:strand:- start:766 stop:1038 length:273 start_codon:yes stop_codon:yes gene_type:complete